MDSSIPLYAAGCIGYRWAVKVLQMISSRGVSACTDTLVFQEVLDWYHFQQRRNHAEIVGKCLNRIVEHTLPVTKGDFEAAYKLARKYPAASPRVLLHIGVMQNNGLRKLIGTWAAEIDSIEEIERVNLIEKLK